jgi:hypothetical protein
MARDNSADDAAQASAENAPPSEKVVISSVVTHAKLMAMIEQRNPIIASRYKARRRAD